MSFGRRVFTQIDFGPSSSTVVVPTNEGGAKGKIAVYSRITSVTGSASLSVYAGYDQDVLDQLTMTSYSGNEVLGALGVTTTGLLDNFGDDEFATQSTTFIALSTYAYATALASSIAEVVSAQDNIFPYLSLVFNGNGDPALTAEVYVVTW